MGSKKPINRREFLRKLTCYSSAGCLAAPLAGTLLSSGGAFANTGQDESQYKALVYIFLAGGNDTYNLLAPMSAGAIRQRYEDGRRVISNDANSMHGLSFVEPPQIYGGEQYDGFGVHQSCSNIAATFNEGELAFICNTGPLVEPTSRIEYENKSVLLPPQLFSHADQQRQFQSEPTDPFRFGWGGRLAELLMPYNQDTQVSSLISTAGLNSFQVSLEGQLNAFVMSRTGVKRLNGFNRNRKALVEELMAQRKQHLMANRYQATFASAQNANSVLNSAFTAADANGVDYDSIFSSYGANESKLGQQLKSISRMIAGRAVSTNYRPVFYVQMGGFDTHQNILIDHPELLTEVDNALGAFKSALKAQGDFDSVLTYCGTEFSRTFTPNGEDESAGTDHGWGGNVFVMGGMVDGGKFYGEYPDFVLSGEIDADGKRGRWIPTTPTSYPAAIIANWMGLPREQMNLLSPTLSNFDDPFAENSLVRFVKQEAL